MNDNNKPDIEALIAEGKPVTDAIRRGGIAAMKQYIRAGESMVSWADGHVVLLSPEELKIRLKKFESLEE